MAGETLCMDVRVGVLVGVVPWPLVGEGEGSRDATPETLAEYNVSHLPLAHPTLPVRKWIFSVESLDLGQMSRGPFGVITVNSAPARPRQSS